MNKDEFIKECNKINVNINNEVYLKLEKYYELLIEWNNRFNLTTIINKNEVYLKHYFDSLCLIKACNLKENKSICDFGTGAGFPGLVLAIVFNNLNITLIESSNKKCTFLKVIKDELNLDNVTIINERVEEYSKNNREIYDIVTCRAVSRLSIIMELCASLIKIGGYFLPLKSNIDDELQNSKELINKLGLLYIKKIEYLLPKEDSKRTIPVIYKKNKTSLKYPRNYSIIKKSK